MVVVVHVFLQAFLEIVEIAKLAGLIELRLLGTEETLHRGNVEAVSALGYARRDRALLQQVRVGGQTLLPILIGMKDCSIFGY
jgi:hypothetical protein